MKYLKGLIIELEDKVKGLDYRIEIAKIEVQALQFERTRLMDKQAKYWELVSDLETLNKADKEGDTK